MKYIALIAASLTVGSLCFGNIKAKELSKTSMAGEWTELFNGKDLAHWDNPYDWGKAEIVDGEIHLSTEKSKWFLSTVKEYSDFIFEVEVKMPEGKCNSGFLFRSHKSKNKMFGYQAEVDPSSRNCRAASTMRDAVVGSSLRTATTQSPKQRRNGPSLNSVNALATASSVTTGTSIVLNAAATVSRSLSMVSPPQISVTTQMPRDTSHCSTMAKRVRSIAFAI